jgi:hypothetical protein
LSIYRSTFFEVPAILIAEPGWRLLRARFARPIDPSTGELAPYRVDSAEWPRFDEFTKFVGTALLKISKWRSFATAARRYLTASFAVGDPLHVLDVEDELAYMGQVSENRIVLEAARSTDVLDRSDVEENVLLNYVFALEALLTGNEEGAITEKIASGAAVLIGGDDREREVVHKTVKDAYRMRSDLVHGRNPRAPVAPVLGILRRIVQRVLAVTTSLAALGDLEEQAYREILRTLPISDEHRRQGREAREMVMDLIGDNGPLESSSS